ITVSIVNNDCQLTDCVWPGDANQDGKADALDLLHIGLGYGASGPPRSGDPEEWTGQVAQDWDWETTDGINYKHLDANGDGTINEFDLLPIIHHYSPMLYDAGFYSSNDGPVVYLDFNVDTIVINQNTGSNINITAGLIIGASSHPVENLHGLSLSLEYDASMTEVVNGVHTQYNPFSFFGNDESVMAFGNSLYNSKQLDFAMSRKADSGINGYGRVATFDFIIVVDIIDGRVESAVPFKLPIKSIRAYDAEGNIIKLNIEAKEAEVVFVKESSTSTQENGLQSKVRLFPNPAKDGSVNIEWKDLEVQSVICYNSLGQQIKATSVENADHLLYVTDDLATGVYLLQIQTDKGLVNKKLLVQ
ncbi:MAG TPA: T9SS type A sorting domain-containing protein, partial [Phaeodactylibacter sp.]|nr:T9SS type A sorting domain-containing protein [Phaeodactylibacter sp.]